MNETNIHQLEELFTETIALDVDARDAHLERVCAGDDRLRRKLQALIDAHGTDDGFLRVAADSTSPTPSPLPQSDVAGRRLGRYTIRRIVARGGMGIVYEAEQDRPRRIVALKVMRPGLVHASARQRFQHEVETLGRMQHVNITRIYEAGIHEDPVVPGEAVPFFAMEYIDGKPLIEYANLHKLDARLRLELMIQVCRAVHFAHQRGIIHRDLKPENILVVNESGAVTHVATEQQESAPATDSKCPSRQAASTSDATAALDDTVSMRCGRPKILDFGIAKATGTDVQIMTLQTDAGDIIGTVPYMSPEQLSGDSRDLDIRSDVYALGVLMFELLANRLPHEVRNKPVAEVMRIVRDEEPPPLSTLDRSYRGDIEIIVSKALEHDKNRRYQSAQELADDIERYLKDRPIAARGDSTWYTLRKSLRRHKLAATMTSLIAVVISVALVISIGFWRQAVIERDRTATALRDASAVNRFLDDMLGSIDPEIAQGRDMSVREIVDDAARVLDTRFANQPVVRASLHVTLGDAYMNLGEYEKSETHLRKAYELRLREQGPENEQTLAAMNDLGRLLTEMEHLDEAESLNTAAEEIALRVLGPEHELTISLQNNHAYLLDWRGRVDEAETLYRRLLALEQRVLGDDSHLTSITRNNLATLIELKGDYAGAEELFRDVCEERLKNLGPAHPATLLARSNVAQVIARLGRLAEAEAMLRETVGGLKHVLGADHPTTINALNSLGTCLDDQGRYAESEKLYRANLETLQDDVGPTHDAVMLARNNLAASLLHQKKFSEAEDILRADVAVFRDKYGEEDRRTLIAMHNLARAVEGQDRPGEAEALLRSVLETRRHVLGPDHPDTLNSLNNLAWTIFDQGRPAEAEPLFKQAVKGYAEAMPEGHWIVAVARGGWGNCLTSLGRFEAAEAELLESYRVEREVLGPDHELTRKVSGYLAALYEAWGNPARAAGYRPAGSISSSVEESPAGDAGHKVERSKR